MKVSTNEATARNFIQNPFIVEAVPKCYPLSVGSCGYGFLNYIILYQDFAIVITEALQPGLLLTDCSIIHGIVSTTEEWVFP